MNSKKGWPISLSGGRQPTSPNSSVKNRARGRSVYPWTSFVICIFSRIGELCQPSRSSWRWVGALRSLHYFATVLVWILAVKARRSIPDWWRAPCNGGLKVYPSFWLKSGYILSSWSVMASISSFKIRLSYHFFRERLMETSARDVAVSGSWIHTGHSCI